MQLLKSEQNAVNLVNAIGIHEAEARIKALTKKAEKRLQSDIDAGYGTELNGMTSFDYLTDDEKEQRHLLLTGINLVTPSQVATAKARVLDRVAKRKMKSPYVQSLMAKRKWSNEKALGYIKDFALCGQQVSFKDFLESR